MNEPIIDHSTLRDISLSTDRPVGELGLVNWVISEQWSGLISSYSEYTSSKASVKTARRCFTASAALALLVCAFFPYEFAKDSFNFILGTNVGVEPATKALMQKQITYFLMFYLTVAYALVTSFSFFMFFKKLRKSSRASCIRGQAEMVRLGAISKISIPATKESLLSFRSGLMSFASTCDRDLKELSVFQHQDGVLSLRPEAAVEMCSDLAAAAAILLSKSAADIVQGADLARSEFYASQHKEVLYGA